jgi:hypothetical protein
VRHGWWPYVQFQFEYPPLALVPILALPAAFSVARYGAELRAVMVVVFAATAVVTTLAAARIWPTLGRPLAAAGAIVPFVPFLIRGAGGVWTRLFANQAGRGAGIESLMATPYLLAQVAGLGHVTVVQVPGGSTELSAPGMAVLVTAPPLLVFVLLAILYAVAWRARHALRDDAEGIVVVALAAILAFICGNKLISPQHVIWLLPLAALGVVSTRASYRVPAVLVLVAAVFTQAEYPFLYDNLVGLHVAGVLAVSIRNGLLVGAYVAALVVVWRRRVAEPASGRAPAFGIAIGPAPAQSPATQPLTGS